MITLATFVKNEAHCLNNMINSVYDFVDEVIVVDTGSIDGTVEGLEGYKKAKVYKVGFTDFGSVRTLTAHLANMPWVLMLDADETLENPQHLYALSQAPLVTAYAFPRKRWLDLDKTQQTELEAYPDRQVRFFRNNKSYTWKRELHEYFDGCPVTNFDDGPVINHFQDVYTESNLVRKMTKATLYNQLAKKAGVTVHGGKVIE